MAVVDDGEYGYLSQYKWHTFRAGNTYYAARNKYNEQGFRVTSLMHREISPPPDGMEIDHMDGDGLNNSRSNLRFCTKQQNQFNQQNTHRVKTSIFKGVIWSREKCKWKAQIGLKRKIIHLGYFDVEEDAARAYNRAAVTMFGEFAGVNSGI